MEDIIFLENNNLFNVFNKEIKHENAINEVDVKVERLEFDDYEAELFDDGALENYDIYKDHIVKEELVVGPEVIQESYVEQIENETSSNQLKKTIRYKSRTFYDCKQCAEVFQSNQARSKHYKTVHATLTCKFCSKTFTKISNLNRHLNYVCPKNEYTKKNNEKKKYGMYTHPFICDICKKQFTHKNTIRTHIQSHLGVGVTYKCHVCDKKYTKKHNLKCHVESQHRNTNIYSCKICKMRFSWRWSLSCHEKNIHGRSKSKAK